MSLINKMLQDLDARGSQAGATLSADVRPAPTVRRRLPTRQIAIAASVVVLGGAAATFFLLRQPKPTVAPVTVVAPVAVAPVAVAAKPVALPPGSQLVTSPMIPLEEARKMPTLVHPSAAASAPVPDTEPVFPAGSVAAAPNRVTPVRAEPAPRVRVVRAPVELRVPAVEAGEAVRMVERPSAALGPVTPVIGGRVMNPSQRAESQYRVALAALDEGRVSAAVEGLEEALRTNPRHDAARQSLVALLIEAGRNDEAMQQLEQSLAADPAQPTLAMLLARMQIERGNSGVATLLRTLPSASGNADYHAFLGGALQREGRHREAAEQYHAALRQAPEHGVWLMGLGISLQAEKRDREALAAFQRAKASGTLTAPLLAFVERKVQQLGQ